MESRRDALRSVAAALAGAVAAAAAVGRTPAEAASGVKCYGIAAAGQNDCANTAGTHACAGQSQSSYDGADWKAMPDAAACTADGGRLEPFEGKNPAKA
jgi:uncharacterized membrane protein